MATKRFTGYLREPLSEYAQHDLWRFTHATTTGEVVKGSTSMFKVDEDGYYDITIQYGTVMIESKDRLSQRWINHGQYTISSATTVTTLPALLLATTPMTPELQQELEAILTDAQQARDQTVALFDSVDGDFIYHNKNAVGPVSRVGGVPTGGLMDWGQNPNGEFFRYANGLQICTIGSIPINYQGNTSYEGSWTYPTPFSSILVVNFSLVNAQILPVLSRRGLTDTPTIGTSHVVLRLIGEGNYTSSPSTLNSRCVAIGRWY